MGELDRILGPRIEYMPSNVNQYAQKEEPVQVPLHLPAPPPPQYDPRRPKEDPKEKGGNVIIIDLNEDYGGIVIDI